MMMLFNKDLRRGSVLLYTCIILVVMGLLGAVIVLNSKTELKVSEQTYLGRDTFSKADSTADLAVLLSRVLVINADIGNPEAYLSTDLFPGTGPKFTVKLREDFNKISSLTQVEGAITEAQIKERYLSAVRSGGRTPDILVFYGDKLIGTAAVAYGVNNPEQIGGSNSDSDLYDVSDGNLPLAYLLITAVGSTPHDETTVSYTDDPRATHSVVTTIYREIIQ